MNELLQNDAVQAALIAFIVVGLKALVEFIKSKTSGSLVESNWCYLQPIVAAFINAAKDAVGKPETGAFAYGNLIAKALVEFQEQYELFEGKSPTESEISAARKELAAALERVIGG